MSYVFTKSDKRRAMHYLNLYIKRHFGEVWKIKSDGEYKGKSWDCPSVFLMDQGIWTLVQHVIHAGGKRAFGNIEVREAGTILRFNILYDTKEGELIV